MVQLRPSSKIFPGFLGQDGLKHISLDTKHKNWDQSVDCFHPVISREKKIQFHKNMQNFNFTKKNTNISH